MKKTILMLILILSCMVLISGSAYAISGVCSNCHTMHDSQNGVDQGDAGQHDYLLLYTCVGCHTGPTVPTTTNGAPVVLRTVDPTGTGAGLSLAGGDFYWVDQGSHVRGHNVYPIVGDDTLIPGNNPPGWDNAQTDGAGNSIAGGAANWAVQLTCAGSYGCHGDHSKSGNDAGIFGAHHGNTGGTRTQASSPTSVGGSYRFLDRIKGLEDTDWNYNETVSTEHNEYFGSTYNDGAALDRGTISFSCAECHGDFHTNTEVGGPTPWLRHPTDIMLDRADGTEYSGYNGGTPPGPNTYSLVAPVARGAVPASSSQNVYPDQTDADGAIVMCLSCHRAHGSEYADILRWDYSTIVAGGSGGNIGCFICHTTKD